MTVQKPLYSCKDHTAKNGPSVCGSASEFSCIYDEGELTKNKSRMVDKKNLARRMDEMALSKYLRLGKSDIMNGVANEPSVKEDLFEAIIGAVVLDCGRDFSIWKALEDEEFLMKLGAVGIGSDGKKHPTSAGLLMFDNEYDVVREYNAYFLDYQEQYNADTRWTDRIISSSEDWSGNIYRTADSRKDRLVSTDVPRGISSFQF